MTGPIYAIRPEPGCTATVEAGRAFGLAIEGRPLFEVESLAWEPPAPERFDGLLLGSANALRAAGDGLEAFRGLPVYAVGAVTAKAAEAAGLRVAAVGRSALQALVAGLRPPLTLLRLTGEEHVPLHPPLGIVVETRVVYRNVPRPMPVTLADDLRAGGVVLLHSAAAARHLAAECDRLSVPRSELALAALGERIAAAAGAGWRALRWATEPRDAALLALARDMCHEPRPT